MGIVLLISLLTMPVAIVDSLSRSYRTIALCAPLIAVARQRRGQDSSQTTISKFRPGSHNISLTLTLIVVNYYLCVTKAGAAA